METATQVLNSLATFVLVASLKTTALVAVVLLLQKVCAGFLSASGRYLLWFPVVLSLLMPLGFEAQLPLDALSANPVPQRVSDAAADPRSSALAELSEPAIGATTPSRAELQTSATLPVMQLPTEAPTVEAEIDFTNWRATLPYLWLLGVMAVLAMLAVTSWRLAALIRNAKPAPPELQRLLDDCMSTTACKLPVRVLHSSSIQVPMMAGVFKPALLLPQAIEQQLTSAQLRHVFIHELMHLQRGDILINWIVAVAQALHWFNPAVWLAFSCMRQDRELACDSATLRHLAPGEKAAYGHTLLQLNDAEHNKTVPMLALGMLTSTTHLQRRIRMLVQSSRFHKLQSSLCGLLLALLAAVAFSQPVPAPRAVVAAEVPAVVAPATPSVEAAVAEPALPALPEESVVVPASAQTESTNTVSTAAFAPIAEPAQPNDIEEVVTAVEQILAQEQEAEVQQPLLIAQIDVPAADPATPASGTDSATSTAAATETSAPALDLAAIEELTTTIAELKAERIPFIQKWDEQGAKCAAKQDSFFGVLSAPCQRIRTALQRREILAFSYECYVLNTIHTQQREQQSALSAQGTEVMGIAAALDANEQELASFCSKDTYSAQYPEFAGIVAEAESPKYATPLSRLPVFEPRNSGIVWERGMLSSTSMVGYAQSGSYSAPSVESYAPGAFAISDAGGGNVGGGMDGGMGGGAVDSGPAAPASP